MKPLFIGRGEESALEDITGLTPKQREGENLYLTKDDLSTHVHIVGASRSGKSKMLECVIKELINNRQGLCLIDPHGNLYDDVLKWLSYSQPNREIILFNPGFESRVVGFNPFLASEGDISVQAERMVQATVKAWGEANSNSTPRLERWLRALYCFLLENNYSLEYIRYILSFKQKEVRQYLVENIQSDVIKGEFEELSNLNRLKDFMEQIESTKNRLFRFMDSKQVRRVIGLDHNNIDLKDIVENGKILLVNLQPKQGILSPESRNLIGTLLLSELWSIASQRQKGKFNQPPKDFFLLIDEFQLFLTPDIPMMLDQAAKYGLHLFLCHQHLSQLKATDSNIYNSVMTNARTKMVFGGLSDEDAQIMVKELFPGQINLKRVKFLIEQTKFWPVVGRNTSRTSSRGGGESQGEGSGSTTGEGTGTTSSVSGHIDDFFIGDSFSQSNSSSNSDSSSNSSFNSSSNSWSESESDIPFIYFEPFKEVSSITPYSLEEQIHELVGVLRRQYQRHFIIHRPGQSTISGITPRVKDHYVSEQTRKKYIEKCMKNYLPTEEVDKALLEIHNDLLLKANASTGTSANIFFNPDDVWENDFANEEEK